MPAAVSKPVVAGAGARRVAAGAGPGKSGRRRHPAADQRRKRRDDWVLQFGGAAETAPAGAPNASSHAAWNAWVLGVIVFLVALSAIGDLEVWQEYWCIILGAWIFAAPWALGFVGLPRASWDHWIDGALIFLLAIWSLARLRNAPVATTVPPLGNRPPRGPVP